MVTGLDVPALFDTNILIDYLSGIEAAATELDSFPDKAISLITWMEVMVGATTDEEKHIIKAFLSQFEMLPIDNPVSALAVEIRQQLKIKLPDAIILATARVYRRLLVTRNTKDFSPDAPGIRMPYVVGGTPLLKVGETRVKKGITLTRMS